MKIIIYSLIFPQFFLIILFFNKNIYSKDIIKILALGDSLTEGFGVEKNEAYPHLLEKDLKKRGYDSIKVINGGISGSTSASAKSRLRWYLKAKPKIIILSLGANDGLRGLDINHMKMKLGETIDIAKKNNIKVLLAGMQMPLNYGPDYTRDFKNSFYELAEIHNVPLIPFLLKDVGGVAKYNLDDGIHPNPEGHKIISNNVLDHLIDLLNQL